MTTDKIQISPFDFVAINELEINRKVGAHASARITGCIRDDKVEEYKDMLLNDTWVTITAVDENGETKTVMTGIIAGFTLEQQRHNSVMTLELKSGTFLMDCTEHYRTFQNMGMNYMDVVNQINATYDGADTIAEKLFKTTGIDFLFQYYETDWSFIKRIASRFGMVLTPSIVREGALYYVGNANHMRYQLSADVRYRVEKHIDRFMEEGANGLGSLREYDYLEYSFTDKEIYELWDLLTIGSKGGYVYEIITRYVKGEFLHTYRLRSMAGMKSGRIINERQAGCSVQAVVKDVKQDKVQVTVSGDENISQEITRWFPYSTGYSSPDGPAWYCMPEIGDQVRLQMPDSAEENSYVISAVHMETSRDRKNPEHKSFKTKYGKELLFTPKTVELTNNQGTSVMLIDGEGIRIVSSKDITIQSRGTMTLSSEEASLVVAGTQSVDIKQGSAGMHLDDDVTFSGGKFRIQ